MQTDLRSSLPPPEKLLTGREKRQPQIDLCLQVDDFFSYKLTYVCIVDSIKFQLEEGGDLVWMMSSALEQETLPFFSCETFMVCNIILSR